VTALSPPAESSESNSARCNTHTHATARNQHAHMAGRETRIPMGSAHPATRVYSENWIIQWRIMQTQQSISYGPILLAIGTWLFAGSEIYQRAAIEFQGTIVSATTTCTQPWNNRRATTYPFKAGNGSQHTYVAGPTDITLPRRQQSSWTLREAWAVANSQNSFENEQEHQAFKSGIPSGWSFSRT
jgi:hypothetical protein